jgi:hypothetical protein
LPAIYAKQNHASLTRDRKSQAPEAVSELIGDMPDEDWGRPRDEDSSDEEAGKDDAGPTTAPVGAETTGRPKSNVWSTNTRAPVTENTRGKYEVFLNA